MHPVKAGDPQSFSITIKGDIMQKIWTKRALGVALAAAGLAGAATASAQESAVTLYGILDAGIGHERVSFDTYAPRASLRDPRVANGRVHQSRTGAIGGVLSGSRFGMRGTHGLGNGSYANFKIESGFNALNGQSGQGGRLFGRDAWLGLGNASWGELRVGRQGNGGDKYLGVVDPFGTAYGVSGMDTVMGVSVRGDNMVSYHTPNINGFEFMTGYSFQVDDGMNEGDEAFATANSTRLFTAGFKYASGPLTLVGTYDRLNPRNNGANDRDDGRPGKAEARLQAFMVGGMYDFEVVRLSAAYSNTRDGWLGTKNLGRMPFGSDVAFDPDSGGIGGVEEPKARWGDFALANGFRSHSTMLGVAIPFGANEVYGSWQRATANNKKLTGGDSTFSVYAVGYKHALSKRTDLYAYGAYTTNYAFVDNAKGQSFGIGMRHAF